MSEHKARERREERLSSEAKAAAKERAAYISVLAAALEMGDRISGEWRHHHGLQQPREYAERASALIDASFEIVGLPRPSEAPDAQ